MAEICPTCLGYGILDMQDVGWIICEDCTGTGAKQESRPTPNAADSRHAAADVSYPVLPDNSNGGANR